LEGLAPVDILLHCGNVVILFVLLRLILWKPVVKALNARAKRVEAEFAAAERTREEAAAMKAEYEQNLGNMDERGREILRDAQIRAGDQATEITETATRQADKMLSDAKERIEAERVEAVHAARHEIAQLATEMAAQILRREVKVSDNAEAARDFFDE